MIVLDENIYDSELVARITRGIGVKALQQKMVALSTTVFAPLTQGLVSPALLTVAPASATISIGSRVLVYCTQTKPAVPITRCSPTATIIY